MYTTRAAISFRSGFLKIGGCGRSGRDTGIRQVRRPPARHADRRGYAAQGVLSGQAVRGLASDQADGGIVAGVAQARVNKIGASSAA